MTNDEMAGNAIEVVEGEVVSENNWHAYTDRFVSAALVLLEANGGNVKRTARELEIPASTLSSWRDGKRRNKHGSLSRDMIKSDLIPMFFDGVKDFFKSSHENMEGMSPYQRGIMGGIYTDKLIALSGIPTQVREVRVLGAIEHRTTAWGSVEDVQNLDKDE